LTRPFRKKNQFIASIAPGTMLTQCLPLKRSNLAQVFGDGEKCIAFAFANNVTWINGCAVLSDKNFTSFYEFDGKIGA